MGGAGSGGHNRLSSAERRARGTSRADRDAPERPSKPKGKSINSAPPDWLSAEAKLVWKRVAPMFAGVMTALDAEQIGNYCEAQVLAVAATKRLHREGLMKKRPDGSMVLNQLVKLARDSRAQALVFAKALGLGVVNGADLDDEVTEPDRYAEAERFLFHGKPPPPLPRPHVQLVAPVVSAPAPKADEPDDEPGPAITVAS